MVQLRVGKRILIVLAVICMIIVALVAIMLQLNVPLASNVKSGSAGYLKGEVFLVPASPRNGYFEGINGHTKGGPVVSEGGPCFIINVMVRNEYTPEQPLLTAKASTTRGAHTSA